MQYREAYLDRVAEQVEDLGSQVHLLQNRFTKQKVSVKLEHYWDLANVHSLFAEFKWRIEQLEEDDDVQLKRDQQVIEETWNQLMRAVDSLLAVLV